MYLVLIRREVSSVSDEITQDIIKVVTRYCSNSVLPLLYFLVNY